MSTKLDTAQHSIGVCHQVAQLLESIRSHSENPNMLSPQLIETLRMAALCHDVGHGVMSHVIENALAGDELVEELLLQFKRTFKRATAPQLSEMAAYYLIRTKAVRELFAQAWDHSPQGKFDPQIPDQIADMIVGRKVNDRLPLIHELISGPFDADKLDYMPRDAKMCGVPVVTDVVRLIQKVRTVVLSSEKLPEELGGVQFEPSGHVITGVARSGASALDEVSLSRSLMFDKIYRHHKVRAAEAMVASVVEDLSLVLTDWVPFLPFEYSDEQFGDLTLDDLTRMNIDRGTPLDNDLISASAEILERLRDRELIVRSFAFAQTMPFDAYRDDSATRAANEEFIRKLSDGRGDRAAFLNEVAEQLRTIANLLGREDDLARLPGRLESYLRVDPPTSGGRGAETDQSRAYLIAEDGRPFKVEKVRAENRGWADAYINTKDVGYVFAPREVADMVHIAAEVVARQKYEVRIPTEMRAYSKLGGNGTDTIRRTLEKKGFYADLPKDLRPVPLYLTEVATSRAIDGVLESLQGYMGPSPGNTSPQLNRQRILDWIMQFPDGFGPLALKTLEGLQMFSREDTSIVLREFLEAHPEFAGASIVPLGEPKDGSSIQNYYAIDAAQELGLVSRTLTAALGASGPIIFIDDIIGRGSSSISIFESMCGTKPSEDLGEHREPPLAPASIDQLKQRPIAVVVTAGFNEGIENVRNKLKEIGLNATVYCRLRGIDLPTIQSVLRDQDPSEVTAFQEELRRIGQAILDDGDAKHDEEWRTQRALGYGNLGVLALSSYNTPTLCLTALWCAGSVDGLDWRPLLPRRKKV